MCFIPSLLPALRVHPPGGEPSAAGSDEGDWHDATCVTRCEEEEASHIHALTLHVSGNICMYSIPWAVCNGSYEGKFFRSRKTCPTIKRLMHHPMHQIECFLQYVLNCSLFPRSPFPLPHSPIQVSSFLPLPPWWHFGLPPWLYSELLQLCYCGRTSSWNRRVC